MTGKNNLINLCAILFEREALKSGGVISHIESIAIFTALERKNYTRYIWSDLIFEFYRKMHFFSHSYTNVCGILKEPAMSEVEQKACSPEFPKWPEISKGCSFGAISDTDLIFKIYT